MMRLGEGHVQTKEVRKNVELLKAVVDNVERQKVSRDRGLERIRAVADGANRRRLAGTGPGANGGVLPASALAVNGGGLVNGASTVEVSRIGERGHLDVDELVKFIQGTGSAKSSRGKTGLRGKRRTGAKR